MSKQLSIAVMLLSGLILIVAGHWAAGNALFIAGVFLEWQLKRKKKVKNG